MHLIRRSAFRAITSPSTSILSKSRSISTSPTFFPRSKPQAFVLPILRRFASNDVNETQKSETESTPSSADSEDQSSIASAISSASESVSTYASDAAESLVSNASQARDTVADTASGIATAAGLAFEPREDRRQARRPRDDYQNDRRSGPPGGGYGDRADRRTAMPPLNLRPTSSIYVGNLLFDLTEEDLKREFGEYGSVKTVRLAQDSRGLSKGFAHIEFSSVDAATAAIEAKNQTVFEGRRIVVNYEAKTRRPQMQPNPPSKTLFIGNLAFEMSDADLNKLFKDVKNVIDVRVAIDRRTGQPRGFAHADFVDVESAVKGMEFLQGQSIYGRTLRVDYSGASAAKSNGEAGYQRGRDARNDDQNREDGY